MHSSRMRIARLLTISRSTWGRGSVQPHWMQTPQMQTSPSPDADHPGCRPPCEQTDACENITLSLTSFAGGNDILSERQRLRLVWTPVLMSMKLKHGEVETNPE